MCLHQLQGALKNEKSDTARPWQALAPCRREDRPCGRQGANERLLARPDERRRAGHRGGHHAVWEVRWGASRFARGVTQRNAKPLGKGSAFNSQRWGNEMPKSNQQQKEISHGNLSADG